MIKQRIAALETVCKKANAPSREEYEEAVYRNYKRLYFDTGTADQDETADSELIKAYEHIHGEQKNTGLYERFLSETDQETEY